MLYLDLCPRSRQIESACFSGTAAFMEVRIQSVVVEFILNNTEALFSPKLNSVIRDNAGRAAFITLLRGKERHVVRGEGHVRRCAMNSNMLAHLSTSRQQHSLQAQVFDGELTVHQVAVLGGGPGSYPGPAGFSSHHPLPGSQRLHRGGGGAWGSARQVPHRY